MRPVKIPVSAKTSCGTVVMSGTSMAPAIAAAGAMVRQYYQDGWYPTGTKVSGNGFIPTGALIKATLLNGTVDMTGISGYPGTKKAGEDCCSITRCFFPAIQGASTFMMSEIHRDF
jgi:hypothetical protein